MVESEGGRGPGPFEPERVRENERASERDNGCTQGKKENLLHWFLIEEIGSSLSSPSSSGGGLRAAPGVMNDAAIR